MQVRGGLAHVCVRSAGALRAQPRADRVHVWVRCVRAVCTQKLARVLQRVAEVFAIPAVALIVLLATPTAWCASSVRCLFALLLMHHVGLHPPPHLTMRPYGDPCTRGAGASCRGRSAWRTSRRCPRPGGARPSNTCSACRCAVVFACAGLSTGLWDGAPHHLWNDCQAALPWWRAAGGRALVAAGVVGGGARVPHAGVPAGAAPAHRVRVRHHFGARRLQPPAPGAPSPCCWLDAGPGDAMVGALPSRFLRRTSGGATGCAMPLSMATRRCRS